MDMSWRAGTKCNQSAFRYCTPGNTIAFFLTQKVITMKKSQKIILTLAVSAFSSMAVMASDHGQSVEYEFFETQSTPSFISSKTREEVLAELAEAQRTGDIAVNAGHENSGQKLNELYPESYPKKISVPGKSRSQVLDELAAAQRSGELNSRPKDQSAY
jgi:hypothetical protein